MQSRPGFSRQPNKLDLLFQSMNPIGQQDRQVPPGKIERPADNWPTGQSRWHRSALCSFWQWLFATRRPTLPRTILSSSSRSLIVKRLSVSRLCPIVGLLLPPLHTCARLGLVIPYNTRHLSTTNEPHEHQVSNRECDSRPP